MIQMQETTTTTAEKNTEALVHDYPITADDIAYAYRLASKFVEAYPWLSLQDLRSDAVFYLVRASRAYREGSKARFRTFSNHCVINGLKDRHRASLVRGLDAQIVISEMFSPKDYETNERESHPDALLYAEQGFENAEYNDFADRFFATLSERDQEILQAKIDGFSNVEIAAAQVISADRVAHILRDMRGKYTRFCVNEF